MQNDPLHTNNVLVDYFRLATFDDRSYIFLLPKIRELGTAWRGRRWLQYSGQQSAEGFFYGVGDQNGRSHFIVQASGWRSHNFARQMTQYVDHYKLPFYCTRIDLQTTKQRPTGWDYLKAHKRLQGAKSVILSDSGSTLYIGSRTSDSFVRIYDKTDNLLRVEFELKGRQAKRTFAALLNEESLSGIWNRYLKGSRVPVNLAKEYFSGSDIAELPEITAVEDNSLKLNWLRQQDGLVYRLLNDHDTQDGMLQLLNVWNEYAESACAKS